MATITMELEDIEQENKQAWDNLYGQTDELIWGNKPLEFVRKSFQKICSLLPVNPILLDAATGEGRNLPILLEFSKNIVACDSSEHAIQKLNRRFVSQVQTKLCDLAQTFFPSASFNGILACDVIETLPNLSVILQEFNRILQPAGFLVCNVPDMRDGIAGYEMEPLSEKEFMYKNQYFFRFQSLNDFIQLLSRENFDLYETFSDTWTEAPHPQYRSEAHSHTSQIIIAQKRF